MLRHFLLTFVAPTCDARCNNNETHYNKRTFTSDAIAHAFFVEMKQFIRNYRCEASELHE